MKTNLSLIYSDLSFYGVSLRAKDSSDVRSDIFANILKKYHVSLKPVSNKLYRVSENAKYEYSYTFEPSRPLSWRVIRNRRVVEDIEQLSSGKYCLNYYDDNGNDTKRVIFDAQHKWVKTNYYNSVYGTDLYCSLVPKEHNGEIVILQYVTGNPYPVTLHLCSVPSSDEVAENVFARVPEPEVMALTNYGVLYFAGEDTHNIYEQILAEEEEKYALAHKPEVYNTEEDVAGGFCFSVDSFDSTKNNDSLFDLTLAQELSSDTSEELIEIEEIAEEVESETVEEVSELAVTTEEEQPEYELPSSESFSLDEQLAAAIKLISDTTHIDIDEDLVLAQEKDEITETAEETVDEASEDIIEVNLDETDEPEPEQEEIIIPDVEFENANIALVDEEETSVIEDDTEVREEVSVIEYDTEVREEVPVIEDDTEVREETPKNVEIIIDETTPDLLLMDDDAIDDYVSTLIDSLLSDAHSTASDYLIQKQEDFVSAETEASPAISHNKSFADFMEENTADVTIESNGLSYFYYGETDSEGRRNGRGRTLMADGKTAYDGEYFEDARHGKGSFYYKDGSLCYYGDWQNNLRQGFGVGISSETGVTHIGNWSNNKPGGIGVRFNANGEFMYVDSACERTNGGIRVVGFTDNSLTVEFWDEKTLKIIRKEISVEDLLK